MADRLLPVECYAPPALTGGVRCRSPGFRSRQAKATWSRRGAAASSYSDLNSTTQVKFRPVFSEHAASIVPSEHQNREDNLPRRLVSGFHAAGLKSSSRRTRTTPVGYGSVPSGIDVNLSGTCSAKTKKSLLRGRLLSIWRQRPTGSTGPRYSSPLLKTRFSACDTMVHSLSNSGFITSPIALVNSVVFLATEYASPPDGFGGERWHRAFVVRPLDCLSSPVYHPLKNRWARSRSGTSSSELSSDLRDALMSLGTFEADETATRTVGAEVEPALPAEPYHQLTLATKAARR